VPDYTGGSSVGLFETATVQNYDPSGTQWMTSLAPSWGWQHYNVVISGTNWQITPYGQQPPITTVPLTTGTAVTQTVNLYSAPAMYIIEGVFLKASAVCGATVSVGSTGVPNTTAFTSAYQLSNAVSTTNFQATPQLRPSVFAADTITFTIKTPGGTGGYIIDLTACAFDIWIKQEVLF
jgi:hypothetical protein